MVPTVISWAGVVLIWVCAVITIRSARKTKQARRSMERIYGDTTIVAGPRNIQFHLNDGRQIPVDATLDRCLWIWVVSTELSSDQVDSMTVDYLPPNTTVEVQSRNEGGPSPASP
jgi:hypothetical protein